MALLGAHVQCNGNFPRYYSTRDLIFDSEGSTWTSSNVSNERRTDFYHMSSLPVSSPCTLLGYNKELLKQTILKHEAIFRDQIRELHRVYHKQRELMDEIKRSELYEHSASLEASWSNSAMSSKNAQKICCSPNLPWSTSQSGVLVSESIQLPLAFAQEKGRQICPAHASTVTDESLKDYKLPKSKCRKIGNKILDLQLPADEYIDSEEGEENERVTKVPRVSAYSLNGISQVLCDSHDKPYGNNSRDFADLNVPFKLEKETAAKSYDLEAPKQHMKSSLYNLSMRTQFGSQTLPNDVINKRQDLEGCSDNPLPDHEKKCEWKSSGQSGGLLYSFTKGIHTEKQSVSVGSLNKNMEQFNDLPCFNSSHQINRGPWTVRKFSISESSAQTQSPKSNGLLGANSASRTCALDQLVSGADMISSEISPAELWKRPVSDFGRSPLAVQASSASLGQNSKLLMGFSGFARDEFYQGTNVKSGANLDGQSFLLNDFCSRSNLLNLPSININDPNTCDDHGSLDSHKLRKYDEGSKDVVTLKNLNLNTMPAGCSDPTVFRSIQITGEEENKFGDSTMGLPCLKELPVCKGKLNEECKISTHVESGLSNPYNAGVIHALKLRKIGESNLGTEKTLVFHSTGKPHMSSSDLHSFHDLPSEIFQNQSKNQRIVEIEESCISDVKSPCILVPDLGEQIPTGERLMKNEKKKCKSLAGIIDLNSSMIENHNIPIDVNIQAPVSPENRECSPPRGESDENQLGTPFQLAEQVQEEQTRVAAEALVSISGFVAHKDLQMTTCSSPESFVSSPLHWFAGIVSTTVDHPEKENKTDFNGKANDHEEFLPAKMNYFEFMTLNLSETKDLDCCCKSMGQTEQLSGSASRTQPRKWGRTNRGRWRKDFQNEILSSLASLSRYEVTEDLQTIGGLVTAGTHSETGSLRSAGRNVSGRGRRRSCTPTSNITDLMLNMKQLTSTTKLGIEKKGLISWGKTCKKRRGQRFPTTKPWFIFEPST